VNVLGGMTAALSALVRSPTSSFLDSCRGVAVKNRSSHTHSTLSITKLDIGPSYAGRDLV
jgi:hypothetical protein